MRRWLLSVAILLTVSMLFVGCVPFGGVPSFRVDNDTTVVSGGDSGYSDDTGTGDTSSEDKGDDIEEGDTEDDEGYYTGNEEDVEVDNAIYVKDIEDMIVGSDNVVNLLVKSLDVLVDGDKVVNEIFLKRGNTTSVEFSMAIYYPGDIDDEQFEELHEDILDMGYSEDDVVIHLSKDEKFIQVSPIKGLEESMFVARYNFLMQVLEVSFRVPIDPKSTAWGLDLSEKDGDCWACVYRIMKTAGIDVADFSKGFSDVEVYSFSVSNTDNRVTVNFAIGGSSFPREEAKRIIEKLHSIYGGEYVSGEYGGIGAVAVSGARCGDVRFEANYMDKSGGEGIFGISMEF